MVVTAIAAAWVPSPASSRLNSTTPSVSLPLDHSSAETVSSLKALMKTSSAPATAAGAANGASDRQHPAQGARAGNRRRFIEVTRDLSNGGGDRLHCQREEAHEVGGEDDPCRAVKAADKWQRPQEQKNAGDGEDDARQRVRQFDDAMQHPLRQA